MKLKGGDRTPTSTSGTSPNDLRDFVVEMFPEATLQESFADRLVFSVPQQSVPSLANCFLQLEKGKYNFVLGFRKRIVSLTGNKDKTGVIAII